MRIATNAIAKKEAPMLKVAATVQELKMAMAAWRVHDETIAFVPTMGALHEGHMELVKRAQNLATRTVVSIFVNPLQFAPSEDLSRYPRPIENDKQLLEAVGCDLLFAPPPEEMYPEGFAARVDPGPMATVLEGAFRPGHFTGVATVVARLLMMVSADYACFGEKDYQQLRIIERVVKDLAIPTAIVPVPIVREADGLALSSRNAYLSPPERVQAVSLSRTLFMAAEKIRDGASVRETLDAGKKQLADAGFRVDYLELADGKNLSSLSLAQDNARLLVAARIGGTRLIDNLALYEETGEENA